MSLSLDPVKPYVDLIKIGLVVLFALVLVTVGTIAGYQWAQSSNVETVAAKDERIASLERSLGDFIGLYDRVNDAAAKQLKDAEDQRKAAEGAAVIARKSEALARKEADDYEARWNEAAKRKPDCAALRAMNMEAVCGIPLR